jgi:hypothetical protein
MGNTVVRAPDSFGLAFFTATILPSATQNAFGTAQTFVPPGGAGAFLPLHIGISALNLGTETLQIRCRGGFSDGSIAGAFSSYTTAQGDVDPQNLLYGLADAANGNAGQAISAKVLTSVLLDCQSNIPSSGASATVRFWGVAY